MSRYWVQERIYASRPLRALYRTQHVWRARRAARRGQPQVALAGLLRAWKHAGGLPQRDRVLFDRLLAETARDAEGAWRPVAENALWHAWRDGDEARGIRRQFAAYPLEDRVRLRTPKPDAPAWRQGDLMVLKRFRPETGEPGVLLVTYNHGIPWFSALYDLGRIAGEYVVVLEPSTWGYQDARFLPYLGRDLDVLVMAQSQPDFEFVAGLESNLVPSRLGAGDWVDPTRFHPKPLADRDVDVAMIGSWDPLKRHEVLFRALRALARRGRDLKVSLVGYEQAWDQSHVERLARRFGVEAALTYHDFIPYDDVAALLAGSRVSVLLSKREGANRAIYESWMADTPTVVYRHHRGVNLDQVTPRNGVLADDDELADALARVLDHPEAFDARAWAEANTGCFVATRRLDEACAEIAARRGVPWTTSPVVRAYAGYVDPADQEAMGAEYERLADYTLPV